jgi:hypothetical protein
MKKLIQIKSFTGRIHRIKPSELLEFYNEQVLKLKDRGRGVGTRLLNDFKVTGTVLIQLFNPESELKDYRMGYNLVVNVGKDAVIDRLQGTGTYSASIFQWQAIGTGTNAAAAGDTALQTEVGTRINGTLSQPTSTTDRLVSTFPAGNGTGAITETGRLDASTVGNLFARQVFSVVNKGALDSLQVTHDITVS